MPSKLPLSYIELSKKNLIHNIKEFRGLSKPGTKFMAVIKGNAYGHGQNLVAKILEPFVDYFQIDSIEELRKLRKVSKKKTFVLGYIQKDDLEEAIKLHCILGVFSKEQLRKINKIAEKVSARGGPALNWKQEIHIAVDAHLGREGFLRAEIPKVLREIKKCSNIKFSGIYAHFANIEDTENFSHAQKQIDEYREVLKLVEKFKLQTHISSTSGFLVYEKDTGAHSLVRLGIGIYGMWPAEHIKFLNKNKIILKPILTWKTKVAQVKTLPEGHTIGYGLTFKTKRETKIALIPQGYADGIPRALSNKGKVLIQGTRCKILGRVSMNMLTVDVSHLGRVKEGDAVVILGHQERAEISAEEIAEDMGTINYEVTTRISALLPRIIV